MKFQRQYEFRQNCMYILYLKKLELRKSLFNAFDDEKQGKD